MKLSTVDSDVLNTLLQSMYRLPHRPVLHLHDEDSCKKFVNLIVMCLNGMDYSPRGFSSTEMDTNRKATAMLESSLDDRVHWLPQYGSILVAHRNTLQTPGTKTIIIIGLDRHSFFLHEDGEGGYSHEAEALDYKTLVAGTVQEAKLESFWKRFTELLSTSQLRDGDRRSAAGGRQGHQFTPTLIHALAIQAIKCPCKEDGKCSCANVVPKGGFTDVGRHTGGEVRNTSFPLARSLLEWCLVQCGSADKLVFQKAMLCVHLRILADRVHRGEEDSKGAQGKDAWKVRADLDVAFRILEVVSLEGTQLEEGGTSIEFVFDEARQLRLRMDEIVQRLADSEAKRFILPDVDSLLQNPGSFRSPRIQLQGEETRTAPKKRDYDEIIERNIGPSHLIDGDLRFDLEKLLTWLTSTHFQGMADHLTVFLRLRTVESIFWRRALYGLDRDYLDSNGTQLLFDVVIEYRSVFHNFENGLDRGSLMMTDLRSRELLVVWIAYCLAFAAARHSHPDVMSNMAVAVHYCDLEHLVLSDRESWGVASAVAAFLKRNHGQTELFSFRSRDATFSFAERFARQDGNLKSIWDKEKKDAESRMDMHWEAVMRKKKEAQQLRSRIGDLQVELAKAGNALDRERADYESRRLYQTYTSRSELDRCEAKVKALKREISHLERHLKDVLRAPTPVCQPLPRVEVEALQWLFFLHQPVMFRVLSTLTFTAQQMLVPRPWRAKVGGPDGIHEVDVFASLCVTKGECLAAFYNAHQRCEFHVPREQRTGTRNDVALISSRPLAETRPKMIGPTSVDAMSSREDGVWYPNNVRIGMEWTGGRLSSDLHGGSAFDPFRVQRTWAISYFTEKLAPDASSLQWAVRLEEDADAVAQRGNRALASQETRPHWLSKTQFLTFCRPRGFPSKQMRDLVGILAERSLPFQLECVHVLLKQSLFHIGKMGVDEKGEVQFGWKRDLTHGDALATIKPILEVIVNEISESPSSYQSALLIGDIAGFLSDWVACIGLKEISRRLADAVVSWARDFGRQAEESAEKFEDSISFRVQQRLLLNISILCLAQGPMSSDDVRLLTMCRAISKNVCVSEGEASDIGKKLADIEKRADSLITRRIDEITQGIMRSRSRGFLTDALSGVIDEVPGGLRWKQRGSSSGFVATGADGCVYAINVLSGTVLVNGLPPSSLPSEILEHKLYRRCFGDRNFEVATKNEAFETIRRVNGFLYNFALKSDGSLRIVETSPHGTMLELLDGTKEAIEQWGEELPTRLKRMHSHWLCRKDKTIILRGKRFFDRSIYFIIALSPDIDGLIGTCHVIPRHLQHCGLREVAQAYPTFPRLVLHDSDILVLFAKLEHRQFVHFIIAGDDCSSERSLSVLLPRYGLTFDYCDGGFHCCEISGFVLAKCQQLNGSLFGFERYLVLRKGDDHAILVGEGDISHGNLSGATAVKTSDGYDKIVQWHKYDVHPRFQTLSATTVASRLFLAALHASTSFLGPDCDSRYTGFKRATELVRGCWVARPLTSDENNSLLKVHASCKGRHSPLSLLCAEAMQSSMAVPFLHPCTQCNSAIHQELADHSVASEKYMNDLENGLLGLLNRLTPNEELRILGQRGRLPVYRAKREILTIEIPPEQAKDVGNDTEDAVHQLVSPAGGREIASSKASNREFPLDFDSHTTVLEKDIVAELRASWEMHQRSSPPEYRCVSNLPAKVASLQRSTLHSRRVLEEHILAALNNSASTMKSGFDLQLLSGIHARATPRDLLAAVLDDELLQELNPSVLEDSRRRLKDCVVEWLRLCVVEDKLQRISTLYSDPQGLQKELRVVRNWDPFENPAWLVFEVEHRLQIWPEQAAVARHLIDNSGDIVQLNMGMGKTRVIIPLLILHWRFHCNEGSIPRITILPALLSEACDFFHQRLTSSIFNIQMVTLPFSRDVQLDNQMAAAMTSLLNLCSANSGFVVVTPEHRLSLGLKVKELTLWSPESEMLATELSVIEESPWIDILDESDELLHHRFQLIYAVGAVQELPAGPHRWCAAEALLGAIHEHPEVGEWIDRHPHFAVQSEEVANESFRPIQITSQSSMVELVLDFCDVLAHAVLSHPPHELEWLEGHSRRNDILKSIISENSPPERMLEQLSDDQRNDVLALRGLLVGGILVHCLQKRHRVDFGVARPGKKLLSIPFRGADTPSLRSEFSHPDCAITFTLLAYYQDGLSEKEVIIAFETLFTLGRNVQRTRYSQWYSLSKASIEKADSELCDKLDSVEKIDLSNRAQLRLLVKFYRRNRRVVDFWLNSCVFPQEMQYYPQRLSATSWNLAECKSHIVGFSGTNDNHRLLPRQVQQYFPNVDSSDLIWHSLLGTNGRMIEIMLNRTSKCLSLKGCNNVNSILEMLKDNPDLRNVQAIIDAGALLAGHSNESPARKLIEAFTHKGVSRFNGIVFFDNMAAIGQWMALEPSGRLLPLNQSPVQESGAFAIFDEPRCRGSDLKLNKTATALLTIGPRMCKDKLVQAAGRMRALAQGQSLVIAGTEFLFEEILETLESPSKEITPLTIIDWTVRNTFRANMEGLYPWSDQGFLYSTSRNKPELAVEDERLALKDYYGGAFHPVSVFSAVEKAHAYHTSRVGIEPCPIGGNEQALMAGILDQAKRYGETIVPGNRGMDEECERELELEREIEEEKEVEIPRMLAVRETDWDKARVLEADSPESLSSIVSVTSVHDFVASHLQPSELSRFAWSREVYGTSNFFRTVTSQSRMPLESSNHYLRLVDTFVAFPNNQVLLVSEREADELINVLWKHAENTRVKVTLAHLSLLRSALDGNVPGLRSNSMILGRNWNSSRKRLFGSSVPHFDGPTDAIIATMQLFAGETVYRTDSRREALKDILRGTDVTLGAAVADPAHIVDARGNSHMFQYSDLERACRALANEEQQAIQDEEENVDA